MLVRGFDLGLVGLGSLCVGVQAPDIGESTAAAGGAL